MLIHVLCLYFNVDIQVEAKSVQFRFQICFYRYLLDNGFSGNYEEEERESERKKEVVNGMFRNWKRHTVHLLPILKIREREIDKRNEFIGKKQTDGEA